MPRLNKSEFEEVMKEINSRIEGLTKEQLEKRRDFLKDLGEMVKDSEDRAKFNLWAGYLGAEIQKRFGV